MTSPSLISGILSSLVRFSRQRQRLYGNGSARRCNESKREISGSNGFRSSRKKDASGIDDPVSVELIVLGCLENYIQKSLHPKILGAKAQSGNGTKME